MLYEDLKELQEKAEKNIDDCINLIDRKQLLDNPETAFVFGKMIQTIGSYAKFLEKFTKDFDEMHEEIKEINENVKKQRKEP